MYTYVYDVWIIYIYIVSIDLYDIYCIFIIYGLASMLSFLGDFCASRRLLRHVLISTPRPCSRTVEETSANKEKGYPLVN